MPHARMRGIGPAGPALLMLAAALAVPTAGVTGGAVNPDGKAVYYVSPSGNDDSSGSAGAPFKSIQRAAKAAVPGDTVIISDGIYTDTDHDGSVVRLTKGGLPSAWITFRAEHRWRAVLECGDNETDYAIRSVSSAVSYIAVEDFEIRGCRKMAAIFNLGEHDIRFSGNRIHDIARHREASLIGMPAIYTGSGTRYTFDGNIFHTIGRLNPGTVPPAPEESCTTAMDYVFKGSAYPGLNACYNHDHALYLLSSKNTIANNIFYDLKSGWAVMSGGPGDLIVNNTFVGDNPGRPGQILVKKSGTVIQNNIFFDDPDCGILMYTPSCGGAIMNNLFYPMKDIGCSVRGYPAQGEWVMSGNVIAREPRFADPSRNDFHLRADSPAVDAGTASGSPLLDHDRYQRPAGSGFDIGAHEYIPVPDHPGRN